MDRRIFLGVVAGALLANFTYSILTSDMPRAWPFIQSGLFLAILMFWLAVIFASLSLFVEPGRVMIGALLIFALSVSSALFLVADLSQPFVGLMQLPKEQLEHTLAPLN